MWHKVESWTAARHSVCWVDATPVQTIQRLKVVMVTQQCSRGWVWTCSRRPVPVDPPVCRCIRPELFTFDRRAESCAADSLRFCLLWMCVFFFFSLVTILPSSFGRISVAHDCKSQLASGAYCTIATETDGRLQAHWIWGNVLSGPEIVFVILAQQWNN